MDFPLYFQTVIWVGGPFFCRIFLKKKPNTQEYAQLLLATWAKLNSVTALLSPCPRWPYIYISKLNQLTWLLCLFLQTASDYLASVAPLLHPCVKACVKHPQCIVQILSTEGSVLLLPTIYFKEYHTCLSKKHPTVTSESLHNDCLNFPSQWKSSVEFGNAQQGGMVEIGLPLGKNSKYLPFCKKYVLEVTTLTLRLFLGGNNWANFVVLF